MKKYLTDINFMCWIAVGICSVWSIACESRHDPPPEFSRRYPLPDLPLPPGMDGAEMEEPLPKQRRAPRAAAAAPRLAAPATNAPDYLVLSQFTISDGSNNFSAKLEGAKFPTIRADGRSAVVIFTARWTNYVIEATADAGGFSNWVRIAAGARHDTNAAIVLIDMHGGQGPARFFRQREDPAPQ